MDSLNDYCLFNFQLLTYQKRNELKVNSVKKLAPNALQFTYQNLKSCKSHDKNETKNIKLFLY